MAEFKVDRALLEANSTDEIVRILQEERDDYTPEAIKIFEEILQGRQGKEISRSTSQATAAKSDSHVPVFQATGEVLIHKPGDAVRILNGILRAMEQEFMIEGEEGSG